MSRDGALKKEAYYIDAVESTKINLVQWLRLAAESTGAYVATGPKFTSSFG